MTFGNLDIKLVPNNEIELKDKKLKPILIASAKLVQNQETKHPLKVLSIKGLFQEEQYQDLSVMV